MDVRAGREATGVRLVHLTSLIDLEGEVLYPNLVITVSAAVGWPDPEHRACARFPQIHNFLGPSVGRVLIARKPSKRAEEIEAEGQRPFDVTDGEINVVYASCGNGAPAGRVRGDPTARPAPTIRGTDLALVRDRGWKPEAYEGWLGEQLVAALLPNR